MRNMIVSMLWGAFVVGWALIVAFVSEKYGFGLGMVLCATGIVFAYCDGSLEWSRRFGDWDRK